MKITSLMKLGHRHLAFRKKQSILNVCSTAVLFGVLFGIVFLLEGIEGTFDNYSDALSGKEIYVVSTSCTNDEKCLDYEATEPIVKKKSQQYNGEIIGKVSSYVFPNKSSIYNVVDEQLVENLIQINLSEYEKGTLFRIISLDQADSLVNRNEEETAYIPSDNTKQKIYSEQEINDLKEKTLGKKFTESFSVPTQEKIIDDLLKSNSPLSEEVESILGNDTVAENNSEDESEESSYTETIEFVVAGISGSAPNPPTISRSYGDVRILDFFLSRMDNTTTISNIFIARENDKSVDFSLAFGFAESKYEFPITKFSKLRDAYNYYSAENCKLQKNVGNCSDYEIKELVGNRLQSKSAIDNFYYTYGYDEIALLLVAAAIAVFTFIRAIGENVHSIALYRSLGASSFDIFFIYFWYLAELCLMSLVLSLAIGLGIAAFVSIKDSAALSVVLTSLFGRTVKTGLLFGIDLETLKIIGAILLTAPVCSILSLDQLSAKNIASKLKK